MRYRGKYLLNYLKENNGIQYDLVVPSYKLDQILRFLKVYFSVLFFRKKGSLLVIQKLYTNGFYANALKLLIRIQGKNTVYDLDDAEYLRHPKETIHFFLKNCQKVVVGSQVLFDYAKQFNAQVALLSSPIIPHKIYQKPLEAPLRIGWIGFYNNHKSSIEQLVFPALKTLDFPIRLKLLGVNRPEQKAAIEAHFVAVPHIQLEIPEGLNWLHEASIYEEIATCHLGLSPLIDHEFNRAKSAFKLKQFLSCKVPVFASPTGENIHFLKAGVDGYFFDNADELRDLILEHRQALLEQTFCPTMANFSLATYASDFLEIDFHAENQSIRVPEPTLIDADNLL